MSQALKVARFLGGGEGGGAYNTFFSTVIRMVRT